MQSRFLKQAWSTLLAGTGRLNSPPASTHFTVMQWWRLIFALLVADASAGSLLVDRAATNRTFAGIGGLSGGGATSRLFVGYPEPQRSQLLDYLFKPNFGASLHILKVEIGGDSQSTDGTESSHMHSKDDLDLTRGYEWWLMTEAKKRNPDIKLYALPWTFPGWVGNDPVTGVPSGSPFTYPNQTAEYITEWVKGAKGTWGLDIDYIGIWNERPATYSYAKALKDTLAAAGFSRIQLVAKDAAADICDELTANPAFAAVVDVVGLHYPSDYANNSGYAVCHELNKPLWASEEYDSYDDYNGAACWARVLHAHFALSGITASIMWNLIGSYYHGTTNYASSMMTAVQPWSGHWENLETLWATAHMTQFTKVGWKYLSVGSGSGQLPQGGFYTTMVDPNGTDFSMFIVKISHDHASCIRPTLPMEVVQAETLTFKLDGFAAKSLAVRWSNYENEEKPQFVPLPDVLVGADGTFTLEVALGDYYTLSTIRTSAKGNYTSPASRPSFPLPYSDNFNSYATSQEAPYWTDQIGTFEIHTDAQNASNKAMRQMVPQLPIGWADLGTQGPMTLIGMKEWYDVSVEVRIRLPNIVAAGCVATRVDQMWKNGVIFCLRGTGGWNLTHAGPPQNGNYSAKPAPVLSGTVAPPGTQGWHTLKLATLGANATGWYDGRQVFTTTVRDYDTGFAAMGTETWHAVEFDDAKIEPLGANWTPTSPCPPPTSGSTVRSRPCQANGVAAEDQTFVLTSDWAIMHKPSGLCVEASSNNSGAGLTMERCIFQSPMQSFVNDYTNIRNQDKPMNLTDTIRLVGTLNGDVHVASSSAPNGWGLWSYFPNTFQLRNTYDSDAALGYPMCLSACA
ncbi:putative galactocerebrosidase [Diplonema papillatum]|nr:putative galactocerebrosidase [Diplonema papillatum]